MRWFNIFWPCVGLLLIIMVTQLVHVQASNRKYIKNFQQDKADPIIEKIVGYSAAFGQLGLGYPKELSHPLDPLTPYEIRLAAAIVKNAAKSTIIKIKCVTLLEPAKAELLPSFLDGSIPPLGTIDRKVQGMAFDPVTLNTSCITLNLNKMKVESWSNAESHRSAPMITTEDEEIALSTAFSDQQVIAKIKALGFNNLEQIIGEVWESGYVADDPKYFVVKRKLVQIFFYVSLGPGELYYAHPLDFVAYVDISKSKVVGIEDLPIHKGFDRTNRTGNSIPMTRADYLSDLLPPNEMRDDVRPIKISQPEGVSFQITGRQVSWQNFKFRVGQHAREGLVINHVTYNDKGKLRPLFYRLSLSAANFYSGDPRPPFHRKTSREFGAFEAVPHSVPLPVHEFCRGSARYFDIIVHNEKGEPSFVPNAICVFEEDAGVLNAHYDWTSDKVATRRSQRLVVRQFVSIGIDYLVSWRFYQDASIQLSMQLTGVETANLMAVDIKSPPYGNLMMPQVYTPSFQYFFGARIDADVDGKDNSVYMEDIVSVGENSRSSQNPYGNGIVTESKLLKTAGESRTDNRPNRYWRISNPTHLQSLNGQPTSWKLVPQEPLNPSLLTNDSPLRQSLFSWAEHNTWVLPFNEEHMLIDGFLMDRGVNTWTNANLTANIVDTDVVLWHVFGLVHFPNLEDWPVVTSIPECGFRLRPSNFFIENPAKTVPLASVTTRLDETGGWPSPDESGTSGSGYSGWGQQ